MRYYVDCEFIEDGKTIDLISIGLIAEDGREYYAVSREFNPDNASDWVIENVLDTLPPPPIDGNVARGRAFTGKKWKPKPDSFEESSQAWKSRGAIAKEIIQFVTDPISPPEFWGEWPSYDWVALCQLYGTMMDLPKDWPMRCRDVVQFLEDEPGLSQDDWPASLETPGNHNALMGAKTVKARWEWCEAQRLARVA